MAELSRVYIDTCCLIDLVRIDLGHTLSTDKQNDAWHVKKLLEANRDGEVQIFTSTLTIAECRHAGENVKVTEAVKSQFSRLLMSGQYLRLVQMTPFIAQDARDLTWKHGLSLKGADSIHVASALDRKCTELLSADGRIKRLGDVGGSLAKLGLVAREARDTKALPEKYRQLELGSAEKLH